jgi:folate-dependent phosphoribosylglycinamide formyltransferase PurN
MVIGGARDELEGAAGMKVALLAPTDRSLYSRLMAWRIHQTPDVELCAIVARNMWSWRRITGELRRDGPRLLDKVISNLILGERDHQSDSGPTLSGLAKEAGLPHSRLSSLAATLGVPFLLAPDHNHPSSEELLRAAQPDIIAFTGGGLIRKNILELSHRGVLNCHAGLLPRYRGMDVVEWAILEAGSQPPETGITLHFMDKGVDTGPIVLTRRIRPQPGDDLRSLRSRFLPAMSQLMLEGLIGLRDGRLEPTFQAPTDGRQYFVMHPRLQQAAADQIRSMML